MFKGRSQDPGKKPNRSFRHAPHEQSEGTVSLCEFSFCCILFYIRRITNQPPLSSIIKSRGLIFGHLEVTTGGGRAQPG